MERSAVFLVEPIAGIERQEFDFRSFGQIRRLIDDESSGLYSSLQRHVITVARRRLSQACRVMDLRAVANRYPDATRVGNMAKSFGNLAEAVRFGTEGSEVQILSPRPIFLMKTCRI